MTEENKLRRTWEVEINEETNDVSVTCKLIPTCFLCSLPENGGRKVYMDGWALRPQNFELEPGSGVKDAYALDTTVTCPVCGSCEVFGTAISKREYEAIRRVLNEQLAKKS